EALVDPAERADRRLDREPSAVACADDSYLVTLAQPIGHVHFLTGTTADLRGRLYNRRRVADERCLVGASGTGEKQRQRAHADATCPHHSRAPPAGRKLLRSPDGASSGSTCATGCKEESDRL